MTPLAVIVQHGARMNSCVSTVLNQAVEEILGRMGLLDKVLAWVLLNFFGKNYYPKSHIIDASKINSANLEYIRDYDVVGFVGLERAESMAFRLAREKLVKRRVLFVEFYGYSEAILRESEGRLDHIKSRLFHLNTHAPGFLSNDDEKFHIYAERAKKLDTMILNKMKAIQ